MNKKEMKLCKVAFDYVCKKKEFENAKDELNSVAEKYFDETDESVFESTGFTNYNVKVTKCQRTKVKFNIDKMYKILPKKLMKKIVRKTVIVEDYLGLINYLKSLNADPDIVKSFLSVSKEVDEKEFNQLYDLGEVKLKDLDGCYEVVKGNAYYTVSVK